LRRQFHEAGSQIWNREFGGVPRTRGCGLDQALLSRTNWLWVIARGLRWGCDRGRLFTRIEFEHNADHHRRQGYEHDNRRPIATARLTRRVAFQILLMTHFIFLRAATDGFVPLSLFLVVQAR
jgi:hypothetical protein